MIDPESQIIANELANIASAVKLVFYVLCAMLGSLLVIGARR